MTSIYSSYLCLRLVSAKRLIGMNEFDPVDCGLGAFCELHIESSDDGRPNGCRPEIWILNIVYDAKRRCLLSGEAKFRLSSRLH